MRNDNENKLVKWGFLSIKLALAVFFGVPYFWNLFYIPQAWSFWFN
jgi:hypothetical protein